MAGPFGFIAPSQRTIAQHAAHATAMTRAKQFSLPNPTLYRGQAIRLFDIWKAPEVIAEVGFPFTRVWQKTGSCVWAGGHCALQSTIAAQRVAATNPTKAFMPFTLHNYAASRHRFGDDSQGEGSMGSTFFASLDEDGVAEWRPGTLGMPQFNHADSAVGVTRNDELAWSSWRNHDVQSVLQTTKANTIASMGECKYVSDARSMLVNGYGVTFACNNYIGNARVEGSGADACLIGYWDSYGPHQQSLHAVWEHPNFGPLYWAQNNWPSNTYPRDPAGGPVCGCWVREAKVESAMRNLDSEVFGLSHLDWFPAQPKLLDWTP